jgi:flagellar biosynthesis protein FliP
MCASFSSVRLVLQFVRSLRPEALPPAVVLSAISIFVATGLMMDLMLKASDQLAGLGGPSTE